MSIRLIPHVAATIGPQTLTMRYTESAGVLEEQRMRTFTILFAVTGIGQATAADGCGPGCRAIAETW
jgi:hypothetical protein